MKLTKEWFIAALIRALKDMASAMLSMVTVGAAITDFDWFYIISVTAGAGVASILISIKGLPETSDATLVAMDAGNIYIEGDIPESALKKGKVTLALKK